MKGSFTKTTILLLCTTLGLTIGIGSAFGQKLVDQSQVKGEMPIDQPKFTPKKQLVPEHLKPKQVEEQKETDSPNLKGEKPIDQPRKRFEKRERLVPETLNSEPKQSSSQEKKDDEQHVPKKKENSKESSTSDNKQIRENPAPENQEEQLVEQGREQAPVDELPSKKQETANSDEQSSEQRLPKSSDHKQKDQDEQKAQEEKNSQTEDGHEIKIPDKVEVESSDGRKVDVTAVIEDIFGEVNNAKEETEEVQKKMENEQLNPKVALQKPNHSTDHHSKQTVENPNEQYSVNNPPRTEQHGVMPMTASNDLNGVLIGLGIAAAGIFYVLFRKGE